MRIGLVGYLGWGNYGDELFVDAYHSTFANAPDVELEVLHDKFSEPYFSMPVAERVAQFDRIIIGGGDLIIPWSRSGLYWKREYLSKPVYLCGVEVPTWGGYNEDVVLGMREFFQHPNLKYIHARSSQSAEWIRKHLQPNVDVVEGTDIVCSLDFERGMRADRVFGIITRPQQKSNYGPIVALLERVAEAGWSVKHIPLAVGPTLMDDVKEAIELPFAPRTIAVARTIEQLTQEIATCTQVCSMKFHGCVVAEMSGVPTISLSRANKFIYFYNRIGKERFLSHAYDENLPSLFDPDREPTSSDVLDALKAQSQAELADLRARILAD